MKHISNESFAAIADLQPNEMLERKDQGDSVTIVRVDKSTVSWGYKFLAFFGCGPYRLRGITSLFQEALKEHNPALSSDVVKKLNERISSFNNRGLRKYFSFLQIGSLDSTSQKITPSASKPKVAKDPLSADEYEKKVDAFIDRLNESADWGGGGPRMPRFDKNTLKESILNGTLVIDKRLRFIPPEIGDLISLRELTFRDHWGVGDSPLPAELGNLKNLKSLTFEKYTELYDIPDVIGELSALESLTIKTEKSLEITSKIGNLKELRDLTIKGAEVYLPQEIGNCTKLQHLTIKASAGSYLPPEIAQCTELQKLNLLGYSAREIPPDIGNCKKLTHLRLECLAEELPDSLWNLTNLVELHIHGNFRSVSSKVEQLTALQHLSIHSKYVSNKDLPSSISTLPKLQTLDLQTHS
ncbi:MAG: hypothetical protein JSR37_01345 [Verrucomicrobia bacterium]|nr:hypothetical protein [Verrucomicrobiota bacterium]MBS0638061.1 hypothetical protein [Verrucomicrobiota bacterium]